MSIMIKFDKGECVLQPLKDRRIFKKMIGNNLTRNRLIALLMHSKEKEHIKYLAKVEKKVTGN